MGRNGRCKSFKHFSAEERAELDPEEFCDQYEAEGIGPCPDGTCALRKAKRRPPNPLRKWARKVRRLQVFSFSAIEEIHIKVVGPGVRHEEFPRLARDIQRVLDKALREAKE